MSQSNARYRMPAEWEPHQGTWFSWPHNVETWPDHLDAAASALELAVIALADGECVHVHVLDAAHESAVARRFARTVAPERLRLHRIPTNDAWCRDHGAIFAFEQNDGQAAKGADAANGALVGLHFRFNAWGEKYLPYDDDAAAA